MNISQSQLALLYVNAVLLGAGLGFFYDLFRVVRILLGERFLIAGCRFDETKLPLLQARGEKKKYAKIRKIVIFAGDFLFCIVSSVAMILLFYRMNNGKIRFWAFPMTGVGFYLYRITLGKFVMLCAETVAFLLETAVRCFFFLVTFPFKWIFKRLRLAAKKQKVQAVEKRRRRRRFEYTQRFEDDLDVRVKEGLLGIADEKGARRDAGNRKQEEAVQPEPVGSDLSGDHRGGVHRRVCQ